MKVYTFDGHNENRSGVVHFRSKKEMVRFARRYCRHHDLRLADVTHRMGEFEVKGKADYIDRLNRTVALANFKASQVTDVL